MAPLRFDTLAVAETLRKANLPNAEALAALTAKSYRITSNRSPLASLDLGASRFGGSPDVPVGFNWPVHRGRPLTFLAQIDLAEVHAAELPATGWLLFFYDVAEQPMGFDPLHTGGAKVIYLEQARDALSRIEHPDVTSAGGAYESCSLSFTATVDLPACGDSLLEAHQLDVKAEHIARYCAAVAMTSGVEACEQYHHLLGHPQLFQGDMRGECELVTQGIYCGVLGGFRDKRAKELLAQATDEWQLLLQLDTDEDGPDWLWDSNGRVYFWIRRSDLVIRAFDKVWLILQCST